MKKQTHKSILWDAYTGVHSLRELTLAPGPILITGAGGSLGQAFARIFASRKLPHRLLKRSQMDIADIQVVRDVIKEISPRAIINTAGYTRIDQAEKDQERCYLENVQGAFNIAAVCAENGIPVVHFSSDLVFSGEQSSPYLEGHSPRPINIFGKSKLEGEQRVLAVNPKALVIRTGYLFGPTEEYNFVTEIINALSSNREIKVADDIVVSPTYIPDLIRTTLDLLMDRERGLVHISNDTGVSWTQFASLIVKYAHPYYHLDSSLIRPCPQSEINYLARRPRNSRLSSERVRRLPSLENALERYFGQAIAERFALQASSVNAMLRPF